MKKLLYIFIIALAGLASCSGNPDEPIPPTPPPPPPSVALSLDNLIGTWEVYYSMKEVTANYDSKPEVYPGFRNIDFDGFKTEFFKEGGIYRFKSFNAVGGAITSESEGRYSISNDSIHFSWKNTRGADTLSHQRVNEFGATAGIMKVDISSFGKISDGTKYKIRDFKALRNTAVAPNIHPGVNKHKVNFEDMSRGKWVITGFAEYYDGQIDLEYSKLMSDTLRGTTYKYYSTPEGKKMCDFTVYDFQNKVWVTTSMPVVIVDDVIYLLYKDSKGDQSMFVWVTEWGKDSFVDLKEDRYAQNVKIIIKTKITLKREPD